MTENYFGITDTGKVRDNNEDAFIAERVPGEKYIIACAIDGVGGYSGGEVAAAIARETILKCFEQPPADMVPMLKDCLVQTNENIIIEKQQDKEHANMACVLTLAIVDIENNQLHYAHVGDTRLYLFRDNSLVKITNDQSFVGFLEDTGRLTEEGAMRHPKRNEIYKALGFGGKIGLEDDYIEIGQSPFLPGDIILLCSDGLSDMINRLEISTILKTGDSLEDKGKQLVAAANKNGGLDNITAVLVQNDKSPTAHQSTRPPVTDQKKNESLKEKITIPSKDNPVFNKPVTLPATPPAKNKSNKGAVIFLSLLCLAFLASSVYLYLNSYNKEQPVEKPAIIIPAKHPQNAQEIKLQDTINKLHGNLLVLNDSLFKTPVIISQAIRVDRDTLFLKTKGNIVLQSDSTLKGTAFRFSSRGKVILLDGLIFSNFDTAVVTQSNALQLNRIQFNNCRVAVQSQLSMPDKKFISGKLNSVFKTDSLPKTAKK